MIILSSKIILNISRKVCRKLWNLDKLYKTAPLSDWQQAIQEEVKTNPQFEDDFEDCDDFASYMWAIMPRKYQLTAVGFVLGSSPFGYHSWNAFITDDQAIYFLEPQTGEIFKPGELKYKPEWIIW